MTSSDAAATARTHPLQDGHAIPLLGLGVWQVASGRACVDAVRWALDGRVSAMLGTHTHVRTADAQLLPGGTAYITDAGMCGPARSVIGVSSDVVIRRFLTQLPARFETATGEPEVSGVFLDLDPETSVVEEHDERARAHARHLPPKSRPSTPRGGAGVGRAAGLDADAG